MRRVKEARMGTSCCAYTQLIYILTGVVADMTADAARKMEAAKEQDDRWVENHAGRDPRAD